MTNQRLDALKTRLLIDSELFKRLEDILKSIEDVEVTPPGLIPFATTTKFKSKNSASLNENLLTHIMIDYNRENTVFAIRQDAELRQYAIFLKEMSDFLSKERKRPPKPSNSGSKRASSNWKSNNAEFEKDQKLAKILKDDITEGILGIEGVAQTYEKFLHNALKNLKGQNIHTAFAFKFASQMQIEIDSLRATFDKIHFAKPRDVAASYMDLFLCEAEAYEDSFDIQTETIANLLSYIKVKKDLFLGKTDKPEHASKNTYAPRHLTMSLHKATHPVIPVMNPEQQPYTLPWWEHINEEDKKLVRMSLQKIDTMMGIAQNHMERRALMAQYAEDFENTTQEILYPSAQKTLPPSKGDDLSGLEL